MKAHAHSARALAGSLLAAVSHTLYAERPGQAERLPPEAPPAVLACIGCHGSRGEGNAASGTPRIAGQSDYYLSKQLDSYADGSRRNRVMEPIARSLPAEVRREVARYYARAAAPVDARARKERVPERGRVLATLGDEALGVQGCRNCHGPGGKGEPPNIPYLAGLDAYYLSAALNAWKDGTRTNDAGLQMFTVVAALPGSDIAAVAQYYASHPPPGPAPPDIVQAPPPKKTAPAEPPTTKSTDEGRGSVGVEQGAPLGGATHGKGAADVSKKPPPGGEPDTGERAKPPQTKTEQPPGERKMEQPGAR